MQNMSAANSHILFHWFYFHLYILSLTNTNQLKSFILRLHAFFCGSHTKVGTGAKGQMGGLELQLLDG